MPHCPGATLEGGFTFVQPYAINTDWDVAGPQTTAQSRVVFVVQP